MTIHVDFLVGWTDLTNTLHTNDRKYLKQNTRINFEFIEFPCSMTVSGPCKMRMMMPTQGNKVCQGSRAKNMSINELYLFNVYLMQVNQSS